MSNPHSTPHIPLHLLLRAHEMVMKGVFSDEIAIAIQPECSYELTGKKVLQALRQCHINGSIPRMTKEQEAARKLGLKASRRARDAARKPACAAEAASNPQPIYDPHRDGWPQPASLTAAICGDPLPGRSALDQRSRAHG